MEDDKVAKPFFEEDAGMFKYGALLKILEDGPFYNEEVFYDSNTLFEKTLGSEGFGEAFHFGNL